MAKKENSDELIVVDAKRYHRVKKALEASKKGEPVAEHRDPDERESTRELVVVDVRRYKKVKQALEASEERYRQLFENVPIGIYRTTPDGRIVDSNPALIAMLGYDSFAELATRNLEQEYSTPDSKRATFKKQLEETGQIKGLETLWKRKDGTFVQVRENAKLVRSDDGRVYYEGTVEDITQSKLAEEAGRIRTQQLEILNCIISRGNLAGSIQEMLDVVLECMVQPLDFDNAGVFMVDPEGKAAQLMASRGPKTDFSLDPKYMALDGLPFSQVLLRGQPLFLDHTQKNHPAFYKKWGWRMVGSVPLVSKGRVVGALNVGSCRRDAFKPDEKEILVLIGKEAGSLVSKLQTEIALRDSEKYYRTLIDTSPDIIIVMDLQSRLLTVNQQFLKVGGYEGDEVIGTSTYDYVVGLDPATLGRRTARFVADRRVSGSEYCFRTKAGSVIPLEVSAGLLYDEAGQAMGVIAVGRDISERKRAETALRASEEKFRSIAEQTGDLIAITDDAGLITYASSSSRALFQREPEEMVGRNFMEFLDAPSIPRAVAAFRSDLESGGRSVGLELTMKRKDGSLFSGELNGSSFHYGGTHGSLVVIRDISRRKRTEEQLRFLSSVTENTSEAIIVTDARFAINYINKVGEELFGYTLEELKGRSPGMFNADPRAGQIQDELYRIVASGKTYLGESMNRRKDGTTFYCEYKVMPLIDDKGTIYAYSSVQRDVSERKEAETRLLAYQEQLRALTSELALIEERERRRIASELHDQIGQNLALCKLKVAALEKDAGGEEFKGELSAVRRLLECSIQDTRSLIFALSPPVLYELGFAAALEWLAEWIGEQYHVPVEFENRSGEEVMGIDRQVILFQVIRELLVNVGKHSQASRAKVILSLEKPSLRVQVNDDGVGFDATRIYDPKGKDGGFGFFSMRERLNYLGGGLEVRSKPGQGTQIILEVPLGEGAAAGRGEDS